MIGEVERVDEEGEAVREEAREGLRVVEDEAARVGPCAGPRGSVWYVKVAGREDGGKGGRDTGDEGRTAVGKGEEEVGGWESAHSGEELITGDPKSIGDREDVDDVV